MTRNYHNLARQTEPKKAPFTLLKGQNRPLQDELRELLFFSGLPAKGIACEMKREERHVRKWISGEKTIPIGLCLPLLTVIDAMDSERNQAIRTRFNKCLHLLEDA